MLTRYGFAAIYIDDVEYKLSPTFQNIDKLGTPKEIIEEVKSLFSCRYVDLHMYISYVLNIFIYILIECKIRQLHFTGINIFALYL